MSDGHGLTSAVQADGPFADRGASRRERWVRFRKRLNPRGVIGSLILMAVVITAVAGPLWVGSPREQDLFGRLKPPGWVTRQGETRILGTDHLGRDLLSRVVHGSRASLLVGLMSVVVAGAIGSTLGILAGFYGGRIDTVVMRLTDIQMSFPPLVMAIAVVAVLGTGLTNVVLTLGIVGWVLYARMVRAEVARLRKAEFIEAIRAVGARDPYIIIRYIVPNVLPTIIVVASFAVAQMIITESSLSFLGLGVPPEVPTWGRILNDSRNFLHVAWWIPAVPGAALFVTLIGLNLVGDWLRDTLDPTLKL